MSDLDPDTEFSAESHARLKRWAYLASIALLTFTVTGSDLTGTSQIAGMSIHLGTGFSIRDGLLLLICLVVVRLLMTWPALPLALRRKRHEVFDHVLALTLSSGAVCAGLYLRTHVWPIRFLVVAMFSLWMFALLHGHKLFPLLYSYLEDEVFRPWVQTDSEAEQLAGLTPFTMYYCPDNPSMRKSIVFLPEGVIGTGRNSHEFRWAVRDGKLNILDDKGQTYSVFRFHRASLTWQNINQRGTPSIRNQYMITGEPEDRLPKAKMDAMSAVSEVANAVDTETSRATRQEN